MRAMDPAARVCPFCGEPPGGGIFCAACGRNLGGVERLPMRAEWEGAELGAGEPSLAVRGAQATAAFLAAMHAAGDPGATTTPKATRSILRVPKVRGWVVRPVDRDDEHEPRRYEPGLFLTVDGRYHRLDSELRGWGQRDFPHYHHTVSPEPIDAPADERLLDDLAAVLRGHGLAGGPERVAEA
jgi:hypothetical protein